MFEVDVAEVDGIWTITPRGEVDSSSSSELRSAIRHGVGTRPVIIDLRAVPFMDSAGLGALVCGIREVRAAGGTATLCVRRGAVARLISATGFDRVLPVVASPEEARGLQEKHART